MQFKINIFAYEKFITAFKESKTHQKKFSTDIKFKAFKTRITFRINNLKDQL